METIASITAIMVLVAVITFCFLQIKKKEKQDEEN